MAPIWCQVYSAPVADGCATPETPMGYHCDLLRLLWVITVSRRLLCTHRDLQRLNPPHTLGEEGRGAQVQLSVRTGQLRLPRGLASVSGLRLEGAVQGPPLLHTR